MAILKEAVETIPSDARGRVFPYPANAFTMRYRRIRARAAKEMRAIGKFRLHDGHRKIESTVRYLGIGPAKSSQFAAPILRDRDASGNVEAWSTPWQGVLKPLFANGRAS
jgi:hypothetical protein